MTLYSFVVTLPSKGAIGSKACLQNLFQNITEPPDFLQLVTSRLCVHLHKHIIYRDFDWYSFSHLAGNMAILQERLAETEPESDKNPYLTLESASF